MLSIPLPFVVSIVLGILLIRLVVGKTPESGGWTIIALVAACALLAVATGLRWSLNWTPSAYLQPILASTLPALAWLSFADLIGRSGRRAEHVLPVIAVATIALVWRHLLDPALFALYAGYGAITLWRGRLGADELVRARLGEAGTAHRAMMFAGLSLMSAGLIDAVIAFDLFTMGGAHSAAIVTGANLVTLVFTAYCVAVAGQSRVDGAEAPTAERKDTASGAKDDGGTGDEGIIEAVDLLMRERRFFRDPNLTLERIARRTGIPARQISGAVNRLRGRNVSQFINEYRIADAARRLVETDDAITTIMLDAGFSSKSNFNREFLRVTGMSPSAFRRSPAKDGGTAGITPQEATSPGSP